jgi:hypothetical protein
MSARHFNDLKMPRRNQDPVLSFIPFGAPLDEWQLLADFVAEVGLRSANLARSGGASSFFLGL